jgi:hypothetical protein
LACRSVRQLGSSRVCCVWSDWIGRHLISAPYVDRCPAVDCRAICREGPENSERKSALSWVQGPSEPPYPLSGHCCAMPCLVISGTPASIPIVHCFAIPCRAVGGPKRRLRCPTGYCAAMSREGAQDSHRHRRRNAGGAGCRSHHQQHRGCSHATRTFEPNPA